MAKTTSEQQAAKEAEKNIREQIRRKRADFSDWMTTFVASNMEQYGQKIMDDLVRNDPREASRFLSNIMKFAAPAASDPEKNAKDTAKKETSDSEAREAEAKIKKLSKTFEK